MSAIELDAFEAFLDAMDNAERDISAREIGLIVRHLYDAGWRITRVPEQVTVGDTVLNEMDSRKFVDALINPPQPNEALRDAAEAFKSTAWPPADLTTKLWATNIPPYRDAWMEIQSVSELLRLTERGASLVEAATLSDAQSFWKDGYQPDAEFTLNGITYQYLTNQIPF
jgi:hypothetical protein